MKNHLETILNEKRNCLKRLRSSIADDCESGIFVENSDNQKSKSNEKSSHESDSDVNKNKFLEVLKKRNKTTQIELNTIEDTDDNEKKHKIFFRLFKNNIIFQIFFPSLLYTSDFDKIRPGLADLIKDGSSLNKLLKSFVGILCSWVVIYCVYFYLRYHLRINVEIATPLLAILFVILLIGLSFNNPKFRCIVLLIVPFMATNRGEYSLTLNF
jgi:hypothetical protein